GRQQLQQRLADAGFYHQAIDGGLGRGTYAALFSYMARVDLAAKGLAIGTGCVANLPGTGMTSELRLAHFIAQTATQTAGYRLGDERLRLARGKKILLP